MPFTYVSTQDVSLRDSGRFDLIYEATGFAPIVFEAMEALAKASQNANKNEASDAARLSKDIQEKVNAELARVQEQVARASRESADVAGKLAQEHGDLAAKQAEKMSAEIAAKIKDHVAQAEKIAKEHAKRSTYVDTWHILDDAHGRFAPYLRVHGKLTLMRLPDGVHYTAAAGDLIAAQVLNQLRTVYDLQA